MWYPYDLIKVWNMNDFTFNEWAILSYLIMVNIRDTLFESCAVYSISYNKRFDILLFLLYK